MSMTPEEIFDHNNMSESRFWQLVAMTDWPNLGYDKPKLEYLEQLTPTEGKQFRKVVDGLWKVLDEFITTDRNPAGGGDDSHSDLLFHIIGMGKEAFNKCVQNYKSIECVAETGYKESFGYAVPYVKDWDNVDEEIAILEEQMARQEKPVDKNLMMFDEVMQNISDCLKNADGKFIAEMYNKICDYEIEYCGDDVWKEKKTS